MTARQLDKRALDHRRRSRTPAALGLLVALGFLMPLACRAQPERGPASTRPVIIAPLAQADDLRDAPEQDGRPQALAAESLRALFEPGLRGCFGPELTGVCAFTLTLDRGDKVTAADYECDPPLATHAPCFRAVMTGTKIEAADGDLVTFELHLRPDQAIDFRYVKRFTLPAERYDSPTVPAGPAQD
jgi:hypothetical protein